MKTFFVMLLLSCALASAQSKPFCAKPVQPAPISTPVSNPVTVSTPVTVGVTANPTAVNTATNSANSAANNNSTNTNTNNNSSNANSTSNSASNSTSTSNSSSNSTQGQTQTSSATGGNASATGGQGGNSSSTASNGSQSNEQVTTQVRQAPSISASSILSTGPCSGSGFSASASAPVGGVGFGRNKTDQGCDTRMDANEMFGIGSKLAGCKLLIKEKKFREAGVTLEDCMGPKPVPVVIEPVAPVAPIVQTPPPSPTPINVTVVLPPPVAIPVPVKPTVRKPFQPVKHMPPACQNGLELKCVKVSQ